MKFVLLSLLYILTEIEVVNTGLNCHRYTPFALRTSQERTIIRETFATITNKSCKDHEQCSRLQITDSQNGTYIALDCLDRNICENPGTWCHRFRDNNITSCDITCCDGNLCAEINKTEEIVTRNSNIPKATCSTFTSFRVNIETREVTAVYTPLETELCEMDERCGGVILTDRNNKTHKASACVNHNHCKNPDMFCKTLTEATDGTFIRCELKCCNKSLCLEKQESNQTSPKCYEYSSFSVEDDEVKGFDNTSRRVKKCNVNELCSRGTFTDRKNNTHVSLDCIASSVCKNPSLLCQYFSESNPESPFVKCNLECCVDDLCYSDSFPKIQSSLSSSSSSLVPSMARAPPPTIAKPSSTTQIQAEIGAILATTMLSLASFDALLQ